MVGQKLPNTPLGSDRIILTVPSTYGVLCAKPYPSQINIVCLTDDMLEEYVDPHNIATIAAATNDVETEEAHQLTDCLFGGIAVGVYGDSFSSDMTDEIPVKDSEEFAMPSWESLREPRSAPLPLD